jgi:hypothetical protein
MLNGKKSALKTHLSLKKPSFTHKVMAHAPHEQPSDINGQTGMSAGRNSPGQETKPNGNEVLR